MEKLTNDELIDYAIALFDSIAYQASKLTTGNVAHNKVHIEGYARRASEYLNKQKYGTK